MLHPLGEDVQRKRLSTPHRLFPRLTIGQHPRQFTYLRDPSTVLLAFHFDCEHDASVPIARGFGYGESTSNPKRPNPR